MAAPGCCLPLHPKPNLTLAGRPQIASMKDYVARFGHGSAKRRSTPQNPKVMITLAGRAQIASMKDYVARFGHGSAKLARQAQSKEKVLAKMVRGGLTEKVKADSVVRTSPGRLKRTLYLAGKLQKRGVKMVLAKIVRGRQTEKADSMVCTAPSLRL